MRQIFKSSYCIIAFSVIFVIGMLLLPKQMLYGWYIYLGIVFTILFALNMTCFIYAMKIQMLTARANGAGILTALAMVVGLSAMSVCGVGAPICGAALGGTVLAVVLPAGAMHYFNEYAIHIIVIMIFVQIGTLLYMKCFNK